jgi:hypothetical protein
MMTRTVEEGVRNLPGVSKVLEKKGAGKKIVSRMKKQKKITDWRVARMPQEVIRMEEGVRKGAGVKDDRSEEPGRILKQGWPPTDKDKINCLTDLHFSGGSKEGTVGDIRMLGAGVSHPDIKVLAPGVNHLPDSNTDSKSDGQIDGQDIVLRVTLNTDEGRPCKLFGNKMLLNTILLCKTSTSMLRSCEELKAWSILRANCLQVCLWKLL